MRTHKVWYLTKIHHYIVTLTDKRVARVQYAFLGGSADNIKKYKLPNGEFAHNMIQQQAGIINSMAINEDGVVASGADNGSLWCARRSRRQRLFTQCSAVACVNVAGRHSRISTINLNKLV